PTLSGVEDEVQIARDPEIRARIQAGLNNLARRSTGSSTLVARAIIVDRLPDPTRNEITDKGSINQKSVIANNPDLVDDLYDKTIKHHVLVADRKG
ncbi:MAG: hypothetical protein RLZZ444_2660, partial [Pseudomonadota bacterium]